MSKPTRSEANKQAWRSRRGRQGSGVGYDAVLAATTAEKSSAVIADELGVTPAYVRMVWRRSGLDPRPAGVRPALCASSDRLPPHDRRK